MSNGSVGGNLYAYDSSHVTILGGLVNGRLLSTGDSNVTISGGTVSGNLSAYGQVTVSGGTIGGMLQVVTLVMEGSDFSIDGRPVDLGEYGTGGRDLVYGTLSGTFPDGETFTNEFEMYNGGCLILTPEPATLALLALGGLGVAGYFSRKRRDTGA